MASVVVLVIILYVLFIIKNLFCSLRISFFESQYSKKVFPQFSKTTSCKTNPKKQHDPFVLTIRIYDAQQSQETINELKRKLREKESKLTDVKLEALTSQHQLDQMKESMNKMKVIFYHILNPLK